MLEKLNWFNLTGLITLVLLIWKWMGLFLRKNHLLKCWGWLSLQNWIRVLTLSLLLKVLPRKLERWFVLWSFFLLRLLCISINLLYDHIWEYCCYVWAGALSCYLELLDELQKRICRTLGPSLAAYLEPLAYRCNVAIFSIGITLVDIHLKWLNWFHFLIFLSPFIYATRISVNSFFPRTTRL